MLAPDPVEILVTFPSKTYSISMAACGGRDQVVKQLSLDGWLAYESPLPKLISILIRSQKTTFLDIGANTGYYTLLAAVLGSEEVRAYEPVQQICEVVKCNIYHTFNTRSHPITVHPIALSNVDGEDQLFVPDASHGLIETSSSLNSNFKQNHAYSLQVTKATLDSHTREFPLRNDTLVVIKIDVESHEPEVLQGAGCLIRTRRPVIIAEILPGFSSAWFQDWANENNYDHYSLDCHEGATKSPRVLASTDHRDHLFVPRELAIEYLLRDLV
jgi:FkbM family methyltransferase